jgi:hypothetical protein
VSSKSFTNLVLYGAFAAAGFAAAILFVVPNGDKAPEFFGAFAAAIIAGVTLILGTFYQDNLTWRRDQKMRERDRNAEAIDLLFWLSHCDFELEFIASALGRIKEKLASENKNAIELPVDTFREIISPNFFGELLERAKAASKLPPEIAGLIAGDLYKTFTIVDRVFMLRQAVADYRPSIEAMEKYIFVVNRRKEKLQDDARLIEAHLVGKGALPKFPEGE